VPFIIPQLFLRIVVISILLSQSEGCSETSSKAKDITMQMTTTSSPATKRELWADSQEETPKRIKQTVEPTTQHTNSHSCSTPLFSLRSSINEAVILTPKRQDYLSWDDYFLAVAILSSKRSKDPQAPEGACIVDDQNRIVGEFKEGR
jgi:hypothetical protein